MSIYLYIYIYIQIYVPYMALSHRDLRFVWLLADVASLRYYCRAWGWTVPTNAWEMG